MAVDHIRSSPLFFGSGRDEFYVSDDPHWVIRKINAQDVDELSAEELLAAGFVTGNETLCPRVKQVQAGEALRVRSMSKEFRVRPVRYYQLMHGNCFRKSASNFSTD